jgi:ribosomal protein S6--L-glutamate ligase
MEAALAARHRTVLLHPARVFLSLSGDGPELASIGGGSVRPDVVLPRIGSTIREFPLTLVRHMESMGIRTVNHADAVACARNKFRTLQALSLGGVPVPRSWYVSNERNAAAALKEIPTRPVVVKRVQGRQGKGVYLARDREDVLRILEDRLDSGEGVILQEYLPPEGRKRDIRILVVGGAVAGAMSLVPRPGDFRANIHMKGRAERIRLPRAVERVALRATEAVGLDISGVDVIHKTDDSLWVVDVNYSPGFKGLERCMGVDIASRIIAYATSPIGRVG